MSHPFSEGQEGYGFTALLVNAESGAKVKGYKMWAGKVLEKRL
jgi:hypothetical protein